MAWAILYEKNVHLFKQLGMSVWKICSKKFVICSNSLGYLFEKVIIPSNSWGYLFKETCSQFEWLGLSVQKRNCPPFEQLKLSVQRKILAKFPSQGNFVTSHSCHVTKFVYKCIMNSHGPLVLCSHLHFHAWIII